MKEEQRKSIVDKINKGLAEKTTLELRKEKLKILSSDETVQTYLGLQKSILDTETDIESYKDWYGDDSLDTRIIRTFNRSTPKDKCDHDVWLYEGSYYEYFNEYRNETIYSLNPPYYAKKEFAYNQYSCIECSKTVQTEKWETFEIIHHVLKDDSQIFKLRYYQEMYYHLLYQGYTSEEAFQEISEEFHRNKINFSKTRHI